MEAYENLGRIGEGTYGIVLKCRHRQSRNLVAIKRFRQGEEDEQVRKTAMREVRMLKALRHENVVRLLDAFRRQDRLHLVFEFVEGTVLEALQRAPSGLGYSCTRRLIWQLIRAVEHLHTHQVIHRDIKPENMLLASSGMLKLCDFGFARVMPVTDAIVACGMSEYVATRWYRAPELLISGSGYGPGVDVWAIGCMLVELETGAPLFPGSSDVDQLWRILQTLCSPALGYAPAVCAQPLFKGLHIPRSNEVESLNVRCPSLHPSSVELLRACLHPSLEQRPSCAELLQYTYFDGIEACFPAEFWAAQAEAQKAVGRGGIAPPPRHLKRKVSDVHAGQRQDVQLLMPCDSFSSRHSDDWHIAAGAVKPGAAAPQTVHINVFAGAPPADARRPALRGTADESGAQMAELSMTAGSSTAQRSSEPGLASHAGVSLDRRCDSWPRLGRAIGQPDSCPGSRDASPLKARQAAAAKLPSLKQAQTPAKAASKALPAAKQTVAPRKGNRLPKLSVVSLSMASDAQPASATACAPEAPAPRSLSTSHAADRCRTRQAESTASNGQGGDSSAGQSGGWGVRQLRGRGSFGSSSDKASGSFQPRLPSLCGFGSPPAQQMERCAPTTPAQNTRNRGPTLRPRAL